jgi:ATP-binding cassette subfamily B protein
MLITHGQVGITAGTLVAFTATQARMFQPLQGLMRVVLDLQTSAALFARIFEYIDMSPAIQDSPGAHAVDESRVGDIEFRDVTFRYPDSLSDETPVLDRISFTVSPGQFIAFVGPSGAGKTTIGYLMARLYEASGGEVLFAGDDVRDLTMASLVDHIGMVSQQSYLFHDSLAANLRYAKPDATDQELRDACAQANILTTIDAMPAGMETVVGEQGYRLSGGERQRIAIARVILKDSPVLILDEATSALDTVSEHIVQEALDQASQNRTTIAIAHRLSTIQHADKIIVLFGGQIVETGTHSELLRHGGVYARLYSEQTVDD